jgi:hypothetical protein
MATEYRKIIIRKGDGTLPSDLEYGELAFQADTGKVFIGTKNGGTREIATGDVKDIIGGTPSDEAILEYDSATSSWVFGVNHKVTNVSFVNGVLSVFSDGSLSGLGVDIFSNTAIDDLNNVNISSATENQLLKYDGTNWVNATFNTGFNTGTFAETTLTTLTSGQTYPFSNFSAYDKIIAILYGEQVDYAHNPEETVYPDGDTVTVYPQHQLVFDFYESFNTGFCAEPGGATPPEGYTVYTCIQQGGTWFGDFIRSFGKVTFRPGGILERFTFNDVRFVEPTPINGHAWKLKLVGVNF